MALPTTALSELLPLVLPRVKGCPNPLAVQELRMAAVEFCEETKLWREIFTVTFDEQNEAISAFPYAQIHEFESADFDDGAGTAYPLEPASYYETTPGDRSTLIDTAPVWITQSSPGTITLVPFGEGIVEIAAIMKPIVTPRYGVSGETTHQAVQNVVATFIAESYGDILAHGALARLLSMPGTPWAEGRAAAAEHTFFRREIEQLASRRISGQQRAKLRSQSSWL